MVTGASAGLGRAMTLALLGAGHRVVALARTPTTMDELVHLSAVGGPTKRLVPVLTDITLPEALERAVAVAVDRFGGVDVLVNNAGATTTQGGKAFYALPIAELKTVIETNLTAPFVLARLVVPGMISQGWGRIINTVTNYATGDHGAADRLAFVP